MPAAGESGARGRRQPGQRQAVARTEFAVVGGGIMGLSAAWALARRGREFSVFDMADTGHRDGGSHGPCRVFRRGYDNPAYVRLSAQAREQWDELEEISGERLLHPTPQLTFGPQMPAVRAAMIAAGAPCELLGAAEAAVGFPGVRVTGDVLVEPESAVIAADRSLAALGTLAGAAGVISTGARVSALADDGRRVVLSTNAGDVEAGRVIVCAGPWTPGLVATAGITMPGAATLEQVAYLAPASDAEPGGAAAAGGRGPARRPPMPIFIHYGGEIPYGLPVPGSDRYKIGIHHGGPAVDPDHQDHDADPGLGERIERAARAFVPGFNPIPVEVERCVYDNSPDTDFILDRIGNVIIGSGTSGHGFKFGPLLGAWLAALAAGDVGNLPGAATTFSLSRFRAR